MNASYTVEFRDPTGDTATKRGLTPEEALILIDKAGAAHLATIVTLEGESR